MESAAAHRVPAAPEVTALRRFASGRRPCIGPALHRLIFALQEMLAHGLRWRYRRAAGRFVPDPDPRAEPDLRL
jgi:hypothetical protein